MLKKSSNFASKTQNETTMIATPVMNKNVRQKSYLPTGIDHIKMVDIREAQLLDPDWRNQPMRQWDDVYEDLCREVGAAYGLNDIREA